MSMWFKQVKQKEKHEIKQKMTKLFYPVFKNCYIEVSYYSIRAKHEKI